MPVTAGAVTVILASIDRIKEILAGLEATEAEPRARPRSDRQAGSDGRAGHGGYVWLGAADAISVGAADRSRCSRSCRRSAALVPEAPGAAAPAPAKKVRDRPDPGAPVASGRSVARRSRARLPRDAIEAPAPVAKAEVKAEPAPAAEAPAPVAKAAKAPRKGRPKKSMLKRAPPKATASPTSRSRQRGYAGAFDDHGLRAGVDPQPAAGDLPPATRTPSSRCRCSGCPTSPRLQEGVMKTRMQPIGNAWQKLPASSAICRPNSASRSS